MSIRNLQSTVHLNAEKAIRFSQKVSSEDLSDAHRGCIKASLLFSYSFFPFVGSEAEEEILLGTSAEGGSTASLKKDFKK